MSERNPNAFSFRNIEELQEKIAELRLDLPLEEDLSWLQQSFKIEGRDVPNSLCMLPMEADDAEFDRGPGDLTMRRYKMYSSGGVGLLWIEATTVEPEGASNPRELWIHEGSAKKFKNLVKMIRENSLDHQGKNQNSFLVLQLTHSGRESKPKGNPEPIIAHYSKILDPRHNIDESYPLISDKELEELKDRFVVATQLAQECGFDAVDIKSAHGYLIHELFNSRTRKNSRYGGSFENRIRFFLEVIEKVKKSVPGMIITSRMCVYDGIPYPYGWGVDMDNREKPDLSEPIELIKMTKKLGVSILNICFGNPYYLPYIERPYDYPVSGGYIPEEHPLKTISRMVDITREIAEAVPEVLLVGTGFSWLRHFFPYLGAAMIKNGWIRSVGVGRIPFANPNFANELFSEGKLKPERQCLTCSSCNQIMKNKGTVGCVVRDAKVYGPIYKAACLNDQEYIRDLAKQCRLCSGPPCKEGCPAGMDIPGFIDAFLNNDLKRAYEIMRETNILPEICAHVCPVNILCEGSCVLRILDSQPVPIHQIQNYIAKKAREEGLTAVKPGKPSGKKVAVIGFGPAGIACTTKLIELGHSVTVFETKNQKGGLASLVIPAEKLEYKVSEDEILGFKLEDTSLFTIKYETKLSDSFNIDKIFEMEFDAVFIAVGLSQDISISRSDKPQGVISGNRFLREVKMEGCTVNGQVAVLGGGNAAIDSAIAAKRCGAEDVFVIYRRSFGQMLVWEKERNKALDEGVHFLILTQPKGYVYNGTSLKGIKLVRTRLGEFDESGRKSPIEIPGSEYVLEVSKCIEAIGHEVPEETRRALSGVEFDRGLIKVSHNSYETSRKGVFAGGDIVNGGSFVVRAVAEGRDAALQIDAFLNGK